MASDEIDYHPHHIKDHYRDQVLQGALGADWLVHHSDTHSTHFFYDRKSGKSMWELPDAQKAKLPPQDPDTTTDTASDSSGQSAVAAATR